MNIRRIEPEDCDAVHSMGSQEEFFCGFWPREVIEDLPDSSDSFAYISEVDGDVVGFVIGSFAPTLRKLIVENLYVLPRYRRNVYEGDVLAGHLAKEAIEHGRNLGARTLSCLVDSNNAISHNLCRQVGVKFSGGDYHWGIYEYEN